MPDAHEIEQKPDDSQTNRITLRSRGSSRGRFRLHFPVFTFEVRLYESSRAVIMVDGLPRAASLI